MSDSLLKLVNPEFNIDFGEKTYTVRKASIEKVVQYQIRAKSLATEEAPGQDAQLVSYAIYLILKDHIPGLTEEMVSEQTPGDLDTLDVLTTLGFLNPTKIQAAMKLMLEAAKSSTTEPSLSTSPSAPAGPQA